MAKAAALKTGKRQRADGPQLHQVTVDVYGHLVPSANRAEVDRLDAIPIRNPDATTGTDSDLKSGAK